MIDIPTVEYCIITIEGKVLLFKDLELDMNVFPCAVKNPEELPTQTAIRAARDLTNLEVEIIGGLPDEFPHNINMIEGEQSHFYQARITGGFIMNRVEGTKIIFPSVETLQLISEGQNPFYGELYSSLQNAS